MTTPGLIEVDRAREALTFPEGFVWGVATSAYQIEGATSADDRVPSIWDSFARQPGAILGGDTGDVAADHFNRYADDLRLMAEFGVHAYRFSIAWPRVQRADGRPNEAGLAFYDRLVDEMLALGIAPVATLYHWDLPDHLQGQGGWPQRDTAAKFADYAELMARRLGDRVKFWTTLNEPWCSAFLGYANGLHAPGIIDQGASLRAAHHLLLGHGLAAEAIRAAAPADVEISITLNLTAVTAASSDPLDLQASAAIDAVSNRIFIDPLFHATYPPELIQQTAHLTDWSFVHATDLATISTGVDVLGVNYYTPVVVKAGSADPTPEELDAVQAYPGCQAVRVVPQQVPVTAMGWPIDPRGLRLLLDQLHTELPNVPLMITENGAAFEDTVADGEVADVDRLRYVRDHLVVAHEAIAAGIDLRGYFLWSFIDNFEWAYGYSQRFGIVHVDFETQRRIPKHSALWYQAVIDGNRILPVAAWHQGA